MERHLSVRQVAERLGFTYYTVWAMVRRGELPAVRIGRTLRIPESAVKNLCREVTDGETKTPPAR